MILLSKYNTFITSSLLLSLLVQSVAYAGLSCLDMGMQDMGMQDMTMTEMNHSNQHQHHHLSNDNLDKGLDNCCESDSGCFMPACVAFVSLLEANLEVDSTLVSAVIYLPPKVLFSFSGIPIYHPPISHLITK